MASQLLNFPLAPFFAIFCRSWLLVCIVGDLLRFCFILARDVWEEDAPPGEYGTHGGWPVSSQKVHESPQFGAEKDF